MPGSRVWRDVAAPAVRVWWGRYGTAIMLFAVGATVAAAAWRLGNELPRLLFEAEGAFDLRLRHREVQRWFDGLGVYGDVERGDYPPASYVILWPLLGWLPVEEARWLWGFTALAALAVVAAIGVRASRAATLPQALLVAILPFSLYASNAAIGMGQLANHVVALLLTGLLLLRHSGARWQDDLLAALLLLAALVKPTLSAPFFWIVWFGAARLRPIVLVSLGYLGLTVFAVSFQDGPWAATLFGWFGEEPQALHGHTNIHKWLALLGLQRWMLPASLGILMATGWWIHRHRGDDDWILLGVAALIGQFWIHHRLYDHLLILIPMITLLRLSWRDAPADASQVTAGVLFGLTWITMLAPATLLDGPPPLSAVMEAAQAVVWLTVLIFLLHRAGREVVGAAGPALRKERPRPPRMQSLT